MPVFLPLPLSHYDWRNPDLDPALTACPPFERLTQEQRALFAAKSPVNAARLDQSDTPGEASRLLGTWRDKGVLLKRNPAFYLTSAQYCAQDQPGRPVMRWGVVGGLRLDVPGPGSTYALEAVDPALVLARLALLTATRGQISPVVALFHHDGFGLADLGREVEDLLPPLAVYRSPSVIHRLWRMPPRHEAWVADNLADIPAFVIQGLEHHQAGLVHRREQGAGERYPWDFGLACLCNTAEPGLACAPWIVLIPPASAEPGLDLAAGLIAAQRRFETRPIAHLDQLWASPHPAALALEHRGALTLLTPLPCAAPGGALGRLGPHAAMELFARRCLGLSACARPWASPRTVVQARLAQAGGQAQAALYVKPVDPADACRAAAGGYTLPAGSVRLSPALPAGLLMHLFR